MIIAHLFCLQQFMLAFIARDFYFFMDIILFFKNMNYVMLTAITKKGFMLKNLGDFKCKYCSINFT